MRAWGTLDAKYQKKTSCCHAVVFSLVLPVLLSSARPPLTGSWGKPLTLTQPTSLHPPVRVPSPMRDPLQIYPPMLDSPPDLFRVFNGPFGHCTNLDPFSHSLSLTPFATAFRPPFRSYFDHHSITFPPLFFLFRTLPSLSAHYPFRCSATHRTASRKKSTN